MKRHIVSHHQSIDAQDGAGVKLKRLFPVAGLDQVDPFVLLDHFGSDTPDDFIAGFPLHPHRGIETVTYMLEGRIRHKDSTGRSGSIDAGDVQWMCAGRGIMHEEMPEVADGRLDGFQLWLNLPAKDKMKPAAYQEFPAAEITDFEHQGHQVKLISGELLGQQGSVKSVSGGPLFADIQMHSGTLNLSLPEQHHAFIYVFEGALDVLGESGRIDTINAPELAILSPGTELVIQADTTARFLLLAARPNDEPIARSGPFVMNTRAEIVQTWKEIREGSFPPD